MKNFSQKILLPRSSQVLSKLGNSVNWVLSNLSKKVSKVSSRLKQCFHKLWSPVVPCSEDLKSVSRVKGEKVKWLPIELPCNSKKPNLKRKPKSYQFSKRQKLHNSAKRSLSPKRLSKVKLPKKSYSSPSLFCNCPKPPRNSPQLKSVFLSSEFSSLIHFKSKFQDFSIEIRVPPSKGSKSNKFM